jgi:hypothetical protein
MKVDGHDVLEEVEVVTAFLQLAQYKTLGFVGELFGLKPDEDGKFKFQAFEVDGKTEDLYKRKSNIELRPKKDSTYRPVDEEDKVGLDIFVNLNGERPDPKKPESYQEAILENVLGEKVSVRMKNKHGVFEDIMREVARSSTLTLQDKYRYYGDKDTKLKYHCNCDNRITPAWWTEKSYKGYTGKIDDTYHSTAMFSKRQKKEKR